MIQGDSVMSEKLKVKDRLSRNDDIREKSRKRSLRTKNSRAGKKGKVILRADLIYGVYLYPVSFSRKPCK